MTNQRSFLRQLRGMRTHQALAIGQGVVHFPLGQVLQLIAVTRDALDVTIATQAHHHLCLPRRGIGCTSTYKSLVPLLISAWPTGVNGELKANPAASYPSTVFGIGVGHDIIHRARDERRWFLQPASEPIEPCVGHAAVFLTHLVRVLAIVHVRFNRRRAVHVRHVFQARAVRDLFTQPVVANRSCHDCCQNNDSFGCSSLVIFGAQLKQLGFLDRRLQLICGKGVLLGGYLHYKLIVRRAWDPGWYAGIPGKVPLRNKYVMAIPCAPHRTENSKVTGMKAGKFSIKEKLGLPPMFIGQSEIMKYHIPEQAAYVAVVAYMNARCPIVCASPR